MKLPRIILESEFGKLIQSAYFIKVQNVIEKFHIQKTKQLLKLNVDVKEYNFELGYN